MLFIADEMICGFGRTGEMFGCETFGIRPDTMTIAKQLSSAYLPIAAVLIPEFMFSAIEEQSTKNGVFAHGYTYGGHPVSAAVALRTLELHEERNIMAHIRQTTPCFQEKLAQFAAHPLVGEVCAEGLLGAVELVADKSNKTPFDPDLKVGVYCEARAREHGLIGRAIGDRRAFYPPLIITKTQIDELFDSFAAALDDTHTWLGNRK